MSRVAARAAALQMIYERLSGGQGGEETLQMIYGELRRTGVKGAESVGAGEPDREERKYISKTLSGVIEHIEDLDIKISEAAIGWTTDRMSMIDLIILRLAVWEMIYGSGVEPSIAISEALNLTEQYSDPSDKPFINGILGTISRGLKQENNI